MADARLKEFYDKEVLPALLKEFSYGNPMEVPRLKRIVLNMGLGEAIQNPKAIEAAEATIATITGQKPVVTRARKSVAVFKLREGMPIGCMVTLRRNRMYEFLDRLINVALPRVRDFRGVNPKGMDGNGNYTLGIREQIIFQEIDYDNVDRVRGMNVTFVTSANTDDEAYALLKHFGMPYRR